MKPPVWTLVLALAGAAGAGCKDSNQRYIGFDAQASDVRADAPASDGSASDVTADAGNEDSHQDSHADATPDTTSTDTAVAADTGSGDDPDGNTGGSDSADAEQGQ